MPDASTLLAFSTAALVLFVIPGPAVLYIISQCLAGGRRAGLVSVGGIHAGSLVHIAAAIAGLTTLLAASAVAFRAVKWAGGAYLVYLGLRALTSNETVPSIPGPRSDQQLQRVFRQGFVVNLLNPKTAVFFLAFVPQFIDTNRGAPSQLLVLGAVFILLGILSDSLYATVFGSVGHRLATARWWRSGGRVIPGATYIGLGIFAVVGGED